MAPRQIHFATGPLLSIASITGLSAIACVAIAAEIDQTTKLRGLLRLLSPDAAYWLMLSFAALCGAVAASLARRLVTDRTAAAIRYDGVWLAGIFWSRLVPWPEVAQLYLRTWRSHDGAAHHFIKLSARPPSGASWLHHRLAESGYGTSVRLIEGGLDQASAWISLAEAEWKEQVQLNSRGPTGSSQRSSPSPPARGFGRKSA